jgi:hypothetical protein
MTRTDFVKAKSKLWKRIAVGDKDAEITYRFAAKPSQCFKLLIGFLLASSLLLNASRGLAYPVRVSSSNAVCCQFHQIFL